MAHDTTGPIPADPQAVERAEHGWEAFTQYGKYLVVAVVVILLGMLIFLV